MAHVVIVDHSDNLGFLHTYHLSRLGCSVVFFNFFSKALVFLKEGGDCEVIFVRIIPPFTKAFELLDELQPLFPGLPVWVLIDSTLYENSAKDVIQKGARGYLLAPCSLKDFERVLRSLNLLPDSL